MIKSGRFDHDFQRKVEGEARDRNMIQFDKVDVDSASLTTDSLR